LDAEVDSNTVCETIRENINISAKESLGYDELKKHKPWFAEGSQNYMFRGNKLNCSRYRIQMK
jgi:hypothetical protein